MPFMALYDIQWWEEVLTDGHEAEFDFADIKVTKDYLSNGYRVLLYEFPNADKAPLARYGATKARANSSLYAMGLSLSVKYLLLIPSGKQLDCTNSCT